MVLVTAPTNLTKLNITLADYATIEDIAADGRIGYTAYWLRRLAQSGKVKAVKVGPARGQWLIHRQSLLDYIAQQRR